MPKSIKYGLILLVFTGIVGITVAQWQLFSGVTYNNLPAGHETTITFEALVPEDVATGQRIGTQVTLQTESLSGSVISDDPATTTTLDDPTYTPTELGISQLPSTGQTPSWRTALLWALPLILGGVLLFVTRRKITRVGVLLMMFGSLAVLAVGAQNQPPAVFLLLDDRLCVDNDSDGFADSGETICYTLRIINGEPSLGLNNLNLSATVAGVQVSLIPNSIQTGNPICAFLPEVNQLRERIGLPALDSLPCGDTNAGNPPPQSPQPQPTTPPGSTDIAPVSVDDDFVVMIFDSVSDTVITNDTAGNPPATLTAVNGSAGDVGVTLTLASGAELTVNADGSFTLDTASATYSAFPATETFTYTLSNSAGSSTATVTITVNTQAATAGDDTYTVTNGSNTTEDLFANDTGITPLTAVSFGGPAEANAGDQPADGTTPYTAASGIVYTLGSNGSLDIDASGATGSGTDTLYYVLQGADGTTDTGMVTVTYGDLPGALDDTYTVAVGNDLNGNLTDNDTFGTPPATLVSFGGGSLGGDVTSNNAGDPVSLAGGTLTVNGDGTFTLTGASVTDVFTFDYQLENTAGTSTATVTITVVTPVSAGDDAYTVTNGSNTTEDLFANDTGAAPLTAVSFGGSAEANAGDQPADGTTPYTPASGIVYTLTSTGNLTIDATGATGSGTDTLYYVVQGAGGTTDTGMVTVTYGDLPGAVDDAYTVAVGNDLNGNLTDNDTFGSPPATLVSFGGGSLGGDVTSNNAGDDVSLAGGTLTVNGDGTFTLTGASVTDVFTFDYQLENTAGTSTATVTITVTNLPVAVTDGSLSTPAYTVAIYNAFTSTTAGGVRNSNDSWTATSPTSVTPDAVVGAFGWPDATTPAGSPFVVPGSGGVTVTIAPDGTITINATAGTAIGGDYQVVYYLTNAAGDSNEADVYFTITQAPVAVADAFSTLANMDLFVPASGFIANDSSGIPPASPVSFGGGDLGGNETSNSIDSTVAFPAVGASAQLTVNGDGSLSLTGAPFNGGVYTFDYRYSNGSVSDAATITITITADDAPTVTNTTPTNNATGVATDSNIVINFSEAVNITAGAFDLECPAVMTPISFTTTPTLPATNITSITLDPNIILPAGTICTVTVSEANVTDTDTNDPPNNMASPYVFTFTTIVDDAPTVTSTTPTDTATGVATDSNIVINFSEAVNITAGAFDLECPAVMTPISFTTTPTLPATNITSITLNPDITLPAGTICTVTVSEANVTDTDTNDPPNNMASTYVFTFTTIVDDAPELTGVEAEVTGVYQPIAGTFPTDGLENVDNDTSIRLTFSEAVNNLAGVTVTCPGGTVTTNGGGLTTTGNGTNTLIITRTTGTYISGETCTISFTESEITDVDTNDPPDALITPSPATYQFQILEVADAVDDAFTVTSHLTARYDTTNLLTNDDPATATVTQVNGAATIGTEVTLPSGAYVTVSANGNFDYTPPPGAGNGDTDSFTYTIETAGGLTDTATVTMTIAGQVIWYVDRDATGPTYNGTARYPFADLAVSANNFDSNAADQAGDFIFVYDSVNDGSTFTCSLTLLDNQRVIGEGESATLAALTGLSPVAETIDTVPATTGNQPQLNSSDGCFVLGANNTIRGLDVVNTIGYAFADGGATVGTATISDVSINGSGGLFSFANGGTINATLDNLSSSAFGNSQINLVNMAGTITGSPMGGIVTESGNANMINVSGGTVNMSLLSTFSKSTGNGALVSVSGGHTGTLTFGGGLMSASSGSGLQFDNADGTYTFNSLQTINGTTAGINVQNGSDGTLNVINSGSEITNVTGISFRVNNSTMDVTYNGNIEHRAQTQRGVEIINSTGSIFIEFARMGDTVTSMTEGTGVYLSNTGNVNTIQFANLYVNIEPSSPGSQGFVSETSGRIRVDYGEIRCNGVLGAGNYCMDITDTIADGVTFDQINVNLGDLGESGGAVQLLNTTGDFIFGIGAVSSRFTIPILANNFGTLTMTPWSGLGSISTDNVAVMDLRNGDLNVSLNRINSFNAAVNGLILENTTGSFTINGTGSAGSGGTITDKTGDGVVLNNASNVSLNWMTIQNNDANGINATGVQNLTVANTSVINNGDGVNDEGLNLNNATGNLTLANVTATGNYYNNLRLVNTLGVLVLDITGGSYSTNNSGGGNHGILIDMSETGLIQSGTISDVTFSSNQSIGLQMVATDIATINNMTISNNTFNTTTATRQQIGLDVSKSQFSDIEVTIDNNTFVGQNSHSMNLFTAAGAGTGGSLTADIIDNNVGNAGVAGSGSQIGNCIRVNMNGDSSNIVRLDNNTLRECPVGRGIEVISRNGTGGLDVTITNNDVDHTNLSFMPGTSDFPLAAIVVQSNAVTVPNSVRADIRGNIVPAGTAYDLQPTHIAVVESGGATTELVNTTGSANCTAQLTATNTGSASAGAGCALIAGPINLP